MEGNDEVKKNSSLKLQKGLSVLLILISVVAILASPHGFWAFLFIAGLIWFVVIRIVE
ncbi:MAG: hypothetical protein SWH54_00415 [Thermodesulfobacteriota bacterium]|nr:hypothetical protein [Thermodesulfobacteriota bacterium]